jgi:endosialidase-like protein
MKNSKRFPLSLWTVLLVLCLPFALFAQSTEDKNQFANINAVAGGVRFEVRAAHSAATLSVAAPDGQVFTKEFPNGTAPEFKLKDGLADGQYTYELRLTPVFGPGVKEALAAARAKGNSDEVQRDLRKRGLLPAQPLVQSGGFTVLNGSVVVAGVSENQRSAKVNLLQPSRYPGATSGRAAYAVRRNHAALLFDQVIPDDLIVQGSICAGLDCVDGESFGFDTIRLKENNTRLQFDDTSTSAGFATNNWQIRANSSASGGASFLGIVDQGATGNSETGTIVLEVDAGAPANSVRVASTGKVGFRTATPVLDMHANTTDTPAIRLEQNNSGGFTAQTWDVAGNEANFFVRDVTAGSRLPFRIRPGAPTSSIDIAATGNVGIGTASPTNAKLYIFGGNDAASTNAIHISSSDGTQTEFAFFSANQATEYLRMGYFNGTQLKNVFFDVGNTGRVGIGTTAPDQMLSVNGDASKNGGGSWLTFSDERLKNIKGQFRTGLNAIMQLRPLRYEYKKDNAVGINSDREYIGFGAQAVQKVIPEAVTANANGYLMVNSDPILWSMVNAIQEQQKQIEELKKEIRQLRSTRARRRR